MWNRLHKIAPKTLSVIGFLTVKQNLSSTHLSHKDKKLDSTFIIKTNLNLLRSTLENCEEVFISNTIKKYYEIKHWRWETQPMNQASTSSTKNNFDSDCTSSDEESDMEF